MILDGTVTVEIGQTFPLKDAAEAHRALEGRADDGRPRSSFRDSEYCRKTRAILLKLGGLIENLA